MHISNRKKPEISWIIPAFNAGPYIWQAIRSIQAQTFTDWEMIVIDDGSCDNTIDIVTSFIATDKRIRLLKMERPSGSAIMPRRKGILDAKADIVAPLDADDSIGPDYLMNLLEIMNERNADAVYPVMYGSDTDYKSPISDVYGELFNSFLPGRECVKLTLNGWRIHCNGGVVKRSLYLENFKYFPEEMHHPNADELLSRYLLYNASRVAMSTEKYYYRIYPNQQNKYKSSKAFSYMITNRALLDFTLDKYGYASEEYMLAQSQAFYGIFRAMRILKGSVLDCETERYANMLIRETDNMLDRKILRSHVSKKYYCLYSLPRMLQSPLLNILDRIYKIFKNTKS